MNIIFIQRSHRRTASGQCHNEAFLLQEALAMAAQVAAYLLVVVYLYPRHNTWLNIGVTAAFAVALVATCRWYAQTRQASSPGWARRYSIAFALTAGLFGAGIALLDITGNREWWLWVPYAALTALPLLAAAAPRLRST